MRYERQWWWAGLDSITDYERLRVAFPRIFAADD